MRTLSEENQKIIRAILQNDYTYLSYYKEKDYVKHIQEMMNAYHRVGDMLASACRKASVLSLEQYSKIVFSFPKVFHELLFANYERDCYAKEFTYDWTAERWERCVYEMSKLKLEMTITY